MGLLISHIKAETEEVEISSHLFPDISALEKDSRRLSGGSWGSSGGTV